MVQSRGTPCSQAIGMQSICRDDDGLGILTTSTAAVSVSQYKASALWEPWLLIYPWWCAEQHYVLSRAILPSSRHYLSGSIGTPGNTGVAAVAYMAAMRL